MVVSIFQNERLAIISNIIVALTAVFCLQNLYANKCCDQFVICDLSFRLVSDWLMWYLHKRVLPDEPLQRKKVTVLKCYSEEEPLKISILFLGFFQSVKSCFLSNVK